MTQSGSIQVDAPQENEGHMGRGAQYVMCGRCVKRVKVLGAMGAMGGQRCECGAAFHDYAEPPELSAPVRGVLPRLIRFWRAGREDGFWNENRFLRSAAAERAGVSPRAARFAYASGKRAGERLRAGARLHLLRVMRMKGLSTGMGSANHAAA